MLLANLYLLLGAKSPRNMQQFIKIHNNLMGQGTTRVIPKRSNEKR